jgi:hypothetical protein
MLHSLNRAWYCMMTMTKTNVKPKGSLHQQLNTDCNWPTTSGVTLINKYDVFGLYVD